MTRNSRVSAIGKFGAHSGVLALMRVRPLNLAPYRKVAPLSKRIGTLTALVVTCAVLAAPALASAKPYISRFNTITTIASAVPTSGPSMGDQNPYGVAVVRHTEGDLTSGDILVSNFNDA